MSFTLHRDKLYNLLPENSLVISYAGVPLHTNEDDYYNFEVNSQFFYLTGLERDGSCFLFGKVNGERVEKLFVEAFDPLIERWTGKIPTKEEVSELSGISSIGYLDEIDSSINLYMRRYRIENVYFDTYRCGIHDEMDYNLKKALEFKSLYPAVNLKDLRDIVLPLRESKDEMEIDCVRKAIAITKEGLNEVLSNLHPGMMEYQVQADFEYRCKYLGAKKWAFPTIAGSGLNGCMMHYGTNHMEVKDGSLILLDLGAKYENYCSDITRTYPANGTYTERQKAYYNLVLKANYAVRDAAKPGLTLKDLNEIAKKVLAEGLIEMGKISDPSEVSKYYMHSVSHSIGIDCHDSAVAGDKLTPGWIISNEPGLYIDEEEIGIRIEDDLLITEDGCEVLSKDIIREADEIEAYMASKKK